MAGGINLKFIESYLIGWFHFRKRRRLSCSETSISLDDTTINPAQIRSVTISLYPPFAGYFPFRRVEVTFSKKNQFCKWAAITSNTRALNLRATIRKAASLDFQRVIDQLDMELRRIETEVSNLYKPDTFVRFSQAQRLEKTYLKKFQGIEKNLSGSLSLEILSLVQKAEVKALIARAENIQPNLASWTELRFLHNENYVKLFQEREHDYFKNVESSALTQEQIKAALTFEDATLVVAAAGSGKSSCIVGKIGFALKTEIFKESQILALAYNKEAAIGLGKRLSNKLEEALEKPVEIASRTFHSFGLSVLTQYHGAEYEPRVLKENAGEEGRFIKDTISYLNDEDISFQAALVEWMLIAPSEDPQPIGTSDDLVECARRYEDCCRDRIRAKKDKSRRWSDPSIPTYSSEIYVRSLQERSIANWLLLRGIEFAYEEADWAGARRLNLPLTKTGKRPPYTPDFTYRLVRKRQNGTLEKVRIVHEHFALDKMEMLRTGWAEIDM